MVSENGYPVFTILVILGSSFLKGSSSKLVKDAISGTGLCSKYGAPGEIPPGSFTSCGDIFDSAAFTAAQLEDIDPKFPCNTTVYVTNMANGKSVTVRLNDHGGGIRGRELDLTFPAFNAIAGDPSLGLINCSYVLIEIGEEDDE